jgi:5-methylthioadenosine/S-adenosylhomocysteine deaminase
MSLLIENAAVITVDGKGADGTGNVFDPGAVFIDGGRIVDVGPSADVAARHTGADRVIDGRRKIVAPGFVSIHNHVGYTVFRGRAEDVGLRVATGQYFPMGTVMSRQERCAIGSLTLTELLRGGVTTVLEMEEDADVFAPFVETLGIRAAMGVMIHDADVDRMAKGEFEYRPEIGEPLLRQAIEFAERWNGAAEGRITTMMTPNMTIGSSPGQLRAMRAAADRLGIRLSIHLGWGPTEVEIIERLHGKSPFEYARENGFLDSDVIAAHCYHMDDAGIDALAASGAHVAHCPLMNSMRGHIAPVLDYRERGINVGLGIDNYFSDHFDTLRACIGVARIRAHDGEVMLAPEALALATIGAARALDKADEIGSLEPGKRADIQVIDCRALGLSPLLDPVRTFVYHAHSHNVETVLVNGEVMVEGGVPVNADPLALVDAAQEAADAAWSRFIAKYGGILAE